MLGGAYAYLFPIDWPEPFGLTMVEAMATGTPVIASGPARHRKWSPDGVTGFVCSTLHGDDRGRAEGGRARAAAPAASTSSAAFRRRSWPTGMKRRTGGSDERRRRGVEPGRRATARGRYRGGASPRRGDRLASPPPGRGTAGSKEVSCSTGSRAEAQRALSGRREPHRRQRGARQRALSSATRDFSTVGMSVSTTCRSSRSRSGARGRSRRDRRRRTGRCRRAGPGRAEPVLPSRSRSSRRFTSAPICRCGSSSPITAGRRLPLTLSLESAPISGICSTFGGSPAPAGRGVYDPAAVAGRSPHAGVHRSGGAATRLAGRFSQTPPSLVDLGHSGKRSTHVEPRCSCRDSMRSPPRGRCRRRLAARRFSISRWTPTPPGICASR